MRIKRNYDLTKVLTKKHSGKWVALNIEQTKVLDYSDNYKDLKAKVANKNAVFMKAPHSGVSYAY